MFREKLTKQLKVSKIHSEVCQNHMKKKEVYTTMMEWCTKKTKL